MIYGRCMLLHFTVAPCRETDSERFCAFFGLTIVGQDQLGVHWIRNVSLKQNYCPSENLTVGEQLYPFRGRCDFRQYIPSKPAEYGLKVWWLCDSSNNYPLRSQIYCDKEGGTVDVNQGERVVKDLVRDYKNTNRNITMDQFFTSYPLSMTLLKWR